MAYLIACLSTGKGSWSHVINIIKKEEWEKIFLVTNQFGKEKFNRDAKTELIVVNFEATTNNIKKEIVEKIKPHLSCVVGFCDVAVNIFSGSGKEHMALISALMDCGVGFRIVDLIDEKVKEI